MKDYNYCCSKDGHGLSFPTFSVVFIQTFSIHRNLEFVLPLDAVLNDYKKVIKDIAEDADKTMVFKSVAEHMGVPVVYMNQNIERQIFVMDGKENALEQKKLCGDRWVSSGILTKRYMKPLSKNDSTPDSSRVWRFPKKAVYRYSLRGFDFHMPLRPTEEEDFEPIDLKGHVNVEMSLFFGNTVSITYRFFFDKHSSRILSVPEEDGGNVKDVDATTDHIIALLSTYLGAEYWSADSEEGSSNINLESTFIAQNFWIDEDGMEVPENERVDLCMCEGGRAFDQIAVRYKKYLYANYTAYREGLSTEDMREHEHFRTANGVSVINDNHYAMVDIWENLKHPMEDDDDPDADLFSKNRVPKLSEAEIINHIRDYHKPELIGLMTLYPGEWPYRDGASFEEVCGENIAIDTDDQVMVGSNIAVVIGTYGRRGDEVKQGQMSEEAHDGTQVQKQGVDWAKHLQDRARYHVSWPEYLMILQMVLAKKYVIGFAKDQLIDVALQARDKSAEELIGKNADLGMRLSRQIIQLDVVKYSKFASHLVMFDRTRRRLHLDEDMEKLKEVTDIVDNSLHNLSNYKAMKSDFLLNIILVIVSVASTFELLFQYAEMPFLSYFDIPSDGLSAWLVLIIATVTIFAILLVLKSSVKKIWNMFVNYK